MRKRMLKLTRRFYQMLGHGSAATRAPQPLRLEYLRQAMLGALGETGCDAYAQTARKLRYADDVQTLWYTRSELMAALAALHGEARARQEIDHLTARFRQLLPRSMTTGTVRAPR